MRTFKLIVENNQVAIPTTLRIERIDQIIRNKKGGFMHIVAYTNAKQLKRANDENMNLIKITDGMYVKRKDDTIINQDFTLTTKITNNYRHKAKHYYIDLNTNQLYDENYLVANRYISRPNNTDSQYRKFKCENIILIK